MKKMRRLIPAIAMLLVSAVMLSTASFAWFTISTEANVSGMNVTATAGSSLLIVDAKNKTLVVGDFSSANGILALAPLTTPLQPATNDNGTMKTIANAGYVDPKTGLYQEGLKDEDGNPITTTLTADGVSEANKYYYDYVVAIGTAGATVTGDLVATLTTEFTKNLHNAVAIDFLVDGVAVEDGTVHLKEVKDGSKAKITLATNKTIPMAIVNEALGTYITITMRVYFDGAYEESAGKTYVRNANATPDGVSWGVVFSVENIKTETPST